jgi:hypothetical protein
VDEHVQPDPLLEPDHPLDLGPDRGVVAGLVQVAGAQGRPGRAQLGGLRERPDRGRRQERQVEALALEPGPFRGGLGAAGGGLRDRGGLRPHGRVADQRRGPPVGERRRVGAQLRRDRARPVVQAPGQGHDLVDLLAGERQPAAQLGVQPSLHADVERDVLERAGRGDHQLTGELPQLAERGQGRLEVGGPDVAAVDDPGHQPLAGQPADGGEQVEVAGAAPGEVEPDALDRGGREHAEGVPGMIEVGRDQQLRAVGEAAEGVVGASQGGQLRLGAVGRERGLVELHPRRARGGQAPEQLRVHVQQVVQQ